MLTRLILRLDLVAECETEHNAAIEYKYKYDEGRKPDPGRAREAGLRGLTNGKSIDRPK